MNTDKKGIISEIERYAIKDGPGIRTVIFFKGCPLRCKWCANPETQRSTYQLMYWPTRCIGCKQCILACPRQALTWNTRGIKVDRDTCVSCGICAKSCNSQALTIAGERKSVSEIMEIVMKDYPYYQTSGGGVTFSGGEATSQEDFLFELAKSCKTHNISTCIETCGYAHWSVYEKLLPYIDYFLYDLKVMDEATHVKFTGASNKMILDNFCRLIRSKANVTVRIPIIPGFNNTDKNICSTISFLLKYASGCHIGLLPYHRLGASKYEKLNMNYGLDELAPPSDEEMCQLKQTFESYGFYVTIGE